MTTVKYQNPQSIDKPRFKDFPGIGNQAVKNYLKTKKTEDKSITKLWNSQYFGGFA
jgi:hypothetical protein